MVHKWRNSYCHRTYLSNVHGTESFSGRFSHLESLSWILFWQQVAKATGPDEVPAELFKAGRETVLDTMHRICVAIWETDEWPQEWTFSTLIPIPKKEDLKQCVNYRTIALVSHASKILLRTILERICVKTRKKRKGDKRPNHGSQNTGHKVRKHQHSLYVLCGLQEGIRSAMISSGWLWWTWDILCTWLTC